MTVLNPILIGVLAMAVPVVATTIVLAWHALCRTDPGPAAQMLLDLVKLVLYSHRR